MAVMTHKVNIPNKFIPQFLEEIILPNLKKLEFKDIINLNIGIIKKRDSLDRRTKYIEGFVVYCNYTGKVITNLDLNKKSLEFHLPEKYRPIIETAFGELKYEI